MKLFFTVLTALTVASMPAKAGNSIKDHQTLFDAIEAVGVPVSVNSDFCSKLGISGAYRWNAVLQASEMQICQDDGRPGGPMVAWTENDLDTLRHEAHHLVQDCLDGVRADDKVSAVLKGDQLQAIRQVLSDSKIQHIIQVYNRTGVTDQKALFAELEAFAVAEAMDASDIAKHVLQSCSFK